MKNPEIVYTKAGLTATVSAFENGLNAGKFTDAREVERQAVRYAINLNNANKRDALETVENYATLETVFHVALPKYEKWSVKLAKSDKDGLFHLVATPEMVEVSTADAYAKLVERVNYAPVNWVHVGYSLLALIDVPFDNNCILNFKPSSISQMREQLHLFGAINSRIIRTMAEALRPSFNKQKDGTVKVNLTEAQVIKAYEQALDINLSTKVYGKEDKKA